MWSILLEAPASDIDSLLSELWEFGTCGMLEEPAGLRAFFEKVCDPVPILSHYEGRLLEVRRESGEYAVTELGDWEGVRAGRRFWIAPPWVTTPAPEGRVRLEVDAAAAFGTGRHESTQLCIEALEHCLKPGMSVLDVGCGSGILCAVARLLGAGLTVACDVDEGAVAQARARFGRAAFAGSADAVAAGRFDLTLANISARVVDRLAFDLKRVTRAGGLLVVSGFLESAPPERFRPEHVFEQNDWACWVTGPEGVSAPAVADPEETAEQRGAWWLDV